MDRTRRPFPPGRAGLLLLPLLALAAAAAGEEPAPAANPYRSYQELTRQLQEMAAQQPELVRLQSIGQTAAGREIWLLEIAAPGSVPPAGRPAIFAAANLDGDLPGGSSLLLETARHLLQQGREKGETRELLERTVIYLLPRLNVDGAEDFFAPVRTGRRTNNEAFDGDNDGRLDEDGPDDLNGDGWITLMRVKKPGGLYLPDPEEARLLKKADAAKGEAGQYDVYQEGRDDDGDGFYNEDPPGGTNPDLNFMHGYPAGRPEAGAYMAKSAETRAVLEFLVHHRQVAAIFCFGASDNLVAPSVNGLAGPARVLEMETYADTVLAEAWNAGLLNAPSTGRMRGRDFAMMDRPRTAPAAQRERPPDPRPAMVVAEADTGFFQAVSAKYRELTGLAQVPLNREPHGAFFQWGYFQYGVLSFSTPGWGLPAGEPSGGQPGGGATERGDRPRMRRAEGGTGAGGRTAGDAGTTPVRQDLTLLRWMETEKIDGFLPWTPFTHPQLGAVEIGGFKPYLSNNPPPAAIPALAEKHAGFLLYLGGLLPRLGIARLEAFPQGGGIYRVEAEVENTGYLPTALAHAVTARAVRPVMVQLGAEADDILAGPGKTHFIPALAGSGGRQRLTWLLRGKPGTRLELKVSADQGGTALAAVTLQ